MQRGNPVPKAGTKTGQHRLGSKRKPRLCGAFSYRAGRTRTYNPRFWRPVLCQLSYGPRRGA